MKIMKPKMLFATLSFVLAGLSLEAPEVSAHDYAYAKFCARCHGAVANFPTLGSVTNQKVPTQTCTGCHHHGTSKQNPNPDDLDSADHTHAGYTDGQGVNLQLSSGHQENKLSVEISSGVTPLPDEFPIGSGKSVTVADGGWGRYVVITSTRSGATLNELKNPKAWSQSGSGIEYHASGDAHSCVTGSLAPGCNAHMPGPYRFVLDKPLKPGTYTWLAGVFINDDNGKTLGGWQGDAADPSAQKAYGYYWIPATDPMAQATSHGWFLKPITFIVPESKVGIAQFTCALNSPMPPKLKPGAHFQDGTIKFTASFENEAKSGKDATSEVSITGTVVTTNEGKTFLALPETTVAISPGQKRAFIFTYPLKRLGLLHTPEITARSFVWTLRVKNGTETVMKTCWGSKTFQLR
jgi:hypothetical protein